MGLTMQKAGICEIFRSEVELHLWHPALTYGQKDAKKMFVDNGVKFCKKWKVPYPQMLRKDMLEYREEIL